MPTFARGFWTAKTAHHNQAVQRQLDGENEQTAPGKVAWIITAADERTLRGIPAIGRGVAGAMRDTQPGR